MKNIRTIIIAAIALAGILAAQAEEISQETAEQLGAMAQKGIETFEWGLLVEAEGSYAKTGDTSESDLVLATVEFAADASVAEWLSGHVGLLWEEDDTDPMALDEGFITIGTDVYAQAGKFYLPFGNFESAFISDSLTLELAEINKSSAMAGYGSEWLGVSAGAFKGDYDNTVEDFYASADFTVSETFECGICWLSSLLETDGMADLNDDLTEKEGGAGVYANLFVGPLMLNAEYITALGDFTIAGSEYQPVAYNLEASVAFAEKWTAGVKYEGSKDLYTEFDGVNLSGRCHRHGCGAVVAYGFHENAVVAAEYLRMEELDDGDGDLVTVQLALEI